MRVHDSVTSHPLSARCPLRWYFVGKFTFSAELMVSYFYLMIASDPCFANLGPSLLWNSTMVARLMAPFDRGEEAWSDTSRQSRDTPTRPGAA